jgi:hypothetical protein
MKASLRIDNGPSPEEMALQSPSTKQTLNGLTEWLLSDRVLRSTKSGEAGVANYLYPDGEHDGLYPEIGGYYLQFLALLGSGRGAGTSADTAEVARHAASRVIKWLEGAGPQGNPLTLYFRDPAYSDWRNECLFAFDLGMILRGFDRAEACWPGIVPGAVMARYSNSIRSLITDARLQSHSLRPSAERYEVPEKWSTRVDVHHVKIAAAVAGLGPRFAERLSGTIEDQSRALERGGNARMRELHPFLYLIEGWLTLWGQSGRSEYLNHASAAFTILMREMNPDRGVLPPIAGRPDLATRSDVLAQALRAGLVLEQANALEASVRLIWPEARRILVKALMSRITPEGAVEFDVVGRHRNVWASLFAWQALSFLGQVGTVSLDARGAAAVLI